jgi:hypothetical protein
MVISGLHDPAYLMFVALATRDPFYIAMCNEYRNHKVHGGDVDWTPQFTR